MSMFLRRSRHLAVSCRICWNWLFSGSPSRQRPYDVIVTVDDNVYRRA